MGYAFISYNNHDRLFANTLVRILNDIGINTWMAPGSISGGETYASVITRAIKDCDCFILVLSRHAQNSEWVPRETERAASMKRPIIAIQIDRSLNLNDEFELYLYRTQIIQMNKADTQPEVFSELISSVKNYIGLQDAVVNGNDSFILKSMDSDTVVFPLCSVNFIGNDRSEATIKIEDDSVSSLHASIIFLEGKYFVCDLNAKKGTYLNGRQLESNKQLEIKEGDIVAFGKKKFVFLAKVSVKDLKATYPPVDVMAAALEVAFPDFAPKEAWKYYREILPMLVCDEMAVAKKLRDNAVKSKALTAVIEDEIALNFKGGQQYQQLRGIHIAGYLANPLAVLCLPARAAGEDYNPNSSEGLVGKLCDDVSLLYDALEGNPFFWKDKNGIMLNLAECLARSFEGTYKPSCIGEFLQVSSSYYDDIEDIRRDAAVDITDRKRRITAKVLLKLERHLFGYLLYSAIHGPVQCDLAGKTWGGRAAT